MYSQIISAHPKFNQSNEERRNFGEQTADHSFDRYANYNEVISKPIFKSFKPLSAKIPDLEYYAFDFHAAAGVTGFNMDSWKSLTNLTSNLHQQFQVKKRLK